MNETEVPVHIGSRIEEFQAAAACLSVRPLLRGAGRICWVAGGIMVLIFSIGAHLPLTSIPMLEALALIALGVYLYTPNPRPGALLLGALAIIAMWANFGYEAYRIWKHAHRVMHVDPYGLIIELLLAARLVMNYFSYRKNFTGTDGETIAELKDLAVSVNKADLLQNPAIVELTQKSRRIRLRRVEDSLLLVERHYIAFGRYSSLDGVRLLKPQDVAVTANGAVKPGKDIKLKLSLPGRKSIALKMKPQYASRLAGLGITASGIAEQTTAIAG